MPRWFVLLALFGLVACSGAQPVGRALASATLTVVPVSSPAPTVRAAPTPTTNPTVRAYAATVTAAAVAGVTATVVRRATACAWVEAEYRKYGATFVWRADVEGIVVELTALKGGPDLSAAGTERDARMRQYITDCVGP